MSRFISRFLNDELGATAIEYGLIAALIAVVIIGAVSAVGRTARCELPTPFQPLARNRRNACRRARGVSPALSRTTSKPPAPR